MRNQRISMAVLAGTALLLSACSAERAGTVAQGDADSPLACAVDLGETLADVRGWLGVAADGSGDSTVNIVDLRAKTANNVFFFTDGKDLVCGSPFDDAIDFSHQTSANQALINAGDVMLGGAGTDSAYATVGGVFHGGDGDDSLQHMSGGTFRGDGGNDAVVLSVRNGTFIGGDGDDTVNLLWGQTFDGGPGTDAVTSYVLGDLVDIESCTANPYESPFGCP